eukprot:scaffold4513_cov37-Cyclotella_meneghiniana.AAC.13
MAVRMNGHDFFPIRLYRLGTSTGLPSLLIMVFALQPYESIYYLIDLKGQVHSILFGASHNPV